MLSHTFMLEQTFIEAVALVHARQRGHAPDPQSLVRLDAHGDIGRGNRGIFLPVFAGEHVYGAEKREE